MKLLAHLLVLFPHFVSLNVYAPLRPVGLSLKSNQELTRSLAIKKIIFANLKKISK